MQETFSQAKDYIHFGLNMQVSELKKLRKDSRIKFSNTANKAALVDLLFNTLAPETANNVAVGGVNPDKTQNSLQAVITGSAAGTFLLPRCGKCQPALEAVHMSASMARECLRWQQV